MVGKSRLQGARGVGSRGHADHLHNRLCQLRRQGYRSCHGACANDRVAEHIVLVGANGDLFRRWFRCIVYAIAVDANDNDAVDNLVLCNCCNDPMMTKDDLAAFRFLSHFTIFFFTIKIEGF